MTYLFQDKSESSENESNKKDENESPGSSTGWTGFNGSGSVAMTGHLAGLLAQNGQNGGSSSVNSSSLLHELCARPRTTEVTWTAELPKKFENAILGEYFKFLPLSNSYGSKTTPQNFF